MNGKDGKHIAADDKPTRQTVEPEDIAIFDDYAKRKIERVFGYRDLSDEILSELGKEYDE